MNTSIYPCIWFNHNAGEAATFYCKLFSHSRIIRTTPMVVTFELEGVKFMGLNGRDQFRPTPALSYFVYCENDHTKIERLYEQLKEGGNVLMPLGKYDWSEKYAWVEDKFGVSWQLDIEQINHPQKIVPAFLFVNEKRNDVKKAVDLYTSVFENSTVLLSFPETGIPTFVQLKLNNYLFNLMSGGDMHHAFDFTEGNSIVIECDTQGQIDHYWHELTKDGTESMCGWLSDPFGSSWQIIPAILGQLMSDPEKAQKVMAAVLKMKKLDIVQLQQAAIS
ncbi:MAG: VOC family protein [Crocinitomicaceae bacterium]|nr:VOC family protein [Crocinitomicaceae bacterium]